MLATSLAAAAALSGCATLEEGAAELTAETYRTTLSGANEVGPGDRDGYARAEISVADKLDQICYDVNDIRNLDNIVGMHVHRGRAGVNGPVVFTLTAANEGGWKGCKKRSEWTEDAIERDPSNYYVNIHTSAYPDGAIRGQLGR
jgi:hypothetical protein